MTDSGQVWFDEFRLDAPGELLWRAHERLSLSPKAFAMLRYLVDHQGQLVSKTALLEAVWPDTVVGDAVLAVGIAELRKALGDDPSAPRFIETVHRRGYRFIGNVVRSQQPIVSSQKERFAADSSQERSQGRHAPRTPILVGRETELTVLHQAFEAAMQGERQIVFVTGEAGSGKTALVDAFLRSLVPRGQSPESNQDRASSRSRIQDSGHPAQGAKVWIGYGQCTEHYSAGEPYLPVLEALTRLCRAPDGADVLKALRLYAPTWLLHTPTLLSPTERNQLWQQASATTSDRMVRELADAVAAFAATQLLVLVFEDLHWSDYATLDVISTLARRPEPTRLLVIGAYRPVEVARGQHPLRTVQHELYTHQQCTIIPLTGLTAEDIAIHLQIRFPQHRFPRVFAELLQQRTNGNPLFLVNMLTELQAQGAIVGQNGQWDLAADVETIAVRLPANTRAVIEQQAARLSPNEQRVLEAASVAGLEFTVEAVAAALDTPLPEVEAQCEALARHGQFLGTADVRELPGGALTAQYAFVHAVYQETMYDRVGAARRIRWHQSIAHWLETVAGEYSVEIATELAVHYEQGRDYERAIHYLEQAARKAMRRGAAHEAIRHLRTALRLLPSAPNAGSHTERELTFSTLLAPALMTAKGYGAMEVEHIYERVLALAQQVEDFPRVFPVLLGVGAFHVVRGKYHTAHAIATQLLDMAERAQDPGLLVEALTLMGVVTFYRGEFTAARARLEQSLAFYDPPRHRSHALQYGQDPWVASNAYLAWTLWILGYPDQAQERSRAALAYAHQLRHPMSLAFALGLAAILQNTCRDAQAGYERAEELLTLAREHGLPYWIAEGNVACGRALVQSGRAHKGLAQILQALQARRETDGLGERPSFVVVVEAYAVTGEAEAGLQMIDEALASAQSEGGRFLEAEIYRLKGELLLIQKGKGPKRR